MRSLRDRLAALQPHSAPAPPQSLPGVPIEAVVSGRSLSLTSGEVFVSEEIRGDPELARFLEHAPVSPTTYLPAVSTPVHPAEIAFLDTETTGLAGGSGTHVFLVGLGYFDGDRFVVRQYFLRHPAEERPFLDALAEILAQFRLVVSFNGRAFDWPLIEARFVLHRYRLQFDIAHFDLLYPARRIWKHRLVSCSLANLESSLFGIERVGDVPGFLIPQTYFDYLRDRDARRLKPVFSHNREDIVTMVRLADLLLRAASAPTASLTHPADQVGLALLLLERSDIGRGLSILDGAIGHPALPPALRRRAEVELSRWLKRKGRAPEAVPIWRNMCERASRSRPLDLFPFVELAKYYEHIARDVAQAEEVVEHALNLLDLRGERAGREALHHRLARLRRKRAAHALRNSRA